MSVTRESDFSAELDGKSKGFGGDIEGIELTNGWEEEAQSIVEDCNIGSALRIATTFHIAWLLITEGIL